MRQVCVLIARLKADGAIRSVVDAVAVGEVFFDNTSNMFILLVKTEGMTLDTLKAAIARQIAPPDAAIRAA